MLTIAVALTLGTACGGASGDAASALLEIVPASAEVAPGQALLFETTSAETVNWDVATTDGGAIDETGVYTAPETEGTYTVVASSPTGDQTTWIRVKRNIRVDVNPSTATVAPGESLTLTTNVTGNIKNVVWSLPDGAAAGTINSAGVYTAPQTAGTYAIIAASAADPSRSDRATITVGAAPPPPAPYPTAAVAVAVSPQAASLVAGNAVQFTATVTGSADAGVTWSVAEAGGGTVSSSGLYSAPSTPGTYRVIATSVADPGAARSASVTVTAPPVSRPVISSFTASPSSIAQGASTTLAWTVSGDTSLSIDNGVGPVTGVSSKSVTPSATTTYRLTATNAGGSVAATVTVSVSVPAAGPSPSARGVGECTALVSHTNDVPTAPLARPAYLQSVIDPAFGTRIVRVTGDWNTPIANPFGDPSLVGVNWYPEAAGPTYSKDSSWNADQTLLVIKRGAPGHLFVDGSTYQPRFHRQRGRSGFMDWRWHPTNAQYGIYVKGNGEVGWWDPRSDTEYMKLPGNSGLSGCRLGNGEGNVSNDGRYLVVQCGTSFFAVDAGSTVGSPGVKYPTITASSAGLNGLDWASISPLGTRVLASQGSSLTKSAPLSLGMTAGQFTAGFGSGHYDVGIGPDGREVAYESGPAKMHDLATGATTVLASIGALQYHGSTRNTAALGWGYGSLESVYGMMRGEIIAHELKPGGRIRRLAHHRTNLTSAANGIEPLYEHCPFGVASPDGTQVLFRSDWGNASAPVYGYVVDTRNLCP